MVSCFSVVIVVVVVDAFDTEQLLDCVQKMRSGHSYQVPIYDFKSHRRCSDSFRQVLTLPNFQHQ